MDSRKTGAVLTRHKCIRGKKKQKKKNNTDFEHALPSLLAVKWAELNTHRDKALRATKPGTVNHR